MLRHPPVSRTETVEASDFGPWNVWPWRFPLALEYEWREDFEANWGTIAALSAGILAAGNETIEIGYPG
jgi:hypothetical protein